MRLGLLISVVLHGAILAWALLSIQSTKPLQTPKPEPIIVDIATIDKVTQAKKGAPRAKPKKVVTKKPPEKAKPKKKPKPAPTKTAALPPPKAEPPKPDPIAEKLKEKPVEIVKPKPKPKPVVKKKPKPKPKPKKVAKKKPKRVPKKSKSRSKNIFDPEEVAALLNKIPDAKPGPKPKRIAKKPAPEKVLADRGAAGGASPRLTISEYDYFIRQIGDCFQIPAGAKEAESFRPVLEFRLRRDGSVDGIPRVINRSNSTFFRIAAESSVRAVLECQPYRLPRDKYDDWKKNKITFDLQAMIGG